jgi:hypothetical protein
MLPEKKKRKQQNEGHPLRKKPRTEEEDEDVEKHSDYIPANITPGDVVVILCNKKSKDKMSFKLPTIDEYIWIGIANSYDANTRMFNGIFVHDKSLTESFASMKSKKKESVRIANDLDCVGIFVKETEKFDEEDIHFIETYIVSTNKYRKNSS